MGHAATCPPRRGGRLVTDTYVKIRNEILAGGTERPQAGETAGGWRAAIGLGVIAALLGLLAWWNWWGFIFVVGILVSIFLHELGHFATARWTGMKATQFFLFMGTKLWSFRRGETEYGVRALPIGAFVRIIGMNNLDDVPPEDEPRAYRSKSFPRRLLVITAGSLMHVVIAFVLTFSVFATNGQLRVMPSVQIGEVLAGGPAAAAGVLPDDIVGSIGGVAVTDPDAFTGAIRANRPGTTVALVVTQPGQAPRTIQVTLGAREDNPAQAWLGVSSGSQVAWNQESVADAAWHSMTELPRVTWQSLGGLIKAFNPVNVVDHLTGKNTDPTTQGSTLVGVTRAASMIGAERGLGGVLLVLAALNVFIGVFNMIPLLPFDGGHAALAIYERIRSRPGRPYRADVRKLIPVSMATVAFLVFIVLSSLYLDIVRPVR